MLSNRHGLLLGLDKRLLRNRRLGDGAAIHAKRLATRGLDRRLHLGLRRLSVQIDTWGNSQRPRSCG